jgi:8-oxo-dGTP pyrophosphatase MutT (NUDIX family)
MTPSKWTVLSKKDVSPNSWFPIESRNYRLPDGNIIEDFTVSTIADVALIVPITKDKKIVLVKQFKPGVDDVMLQFPAGRMESHHTDMKEVAVHELEEETGIRIDKSQLTQFARFTGFSTKASEVVYCYIATDCTFNSSQHLDVTEDIEVVTVSMQEMDRLVSTNEIWCSQTVASWELVKKKFPDIL